MLNLVLCGWFPPHSLAGQELWTLASPARIDDVPGPVKIVGVNLPVDGPRRDPISLFGGPVPPGEAGGTVSQIRGESGPPPRIRNELKGSHNGRDRMWLDEGTETGIYSL